MKNLIVFPLFLASTLFTFAQTAQKDNDYEMDSYKRNRALYAIGAAFEQFTFNPLNTDSAGTVPATVDSDNLDKASAEGEGTVSLHINVVGLTTQNPINANIEIFYNSDFIKVDSGKVGNGKFNTTLANFGWYMISLSAPGYFEASDTIWVTSEQRKTINKNFYMAPVEIGMNMTQNNISFNFAKTSLSEQSLAELDKEAIFFNKNPNVVFEIAGHTDSDGPKGYNLLLSQWRAQAVVNYLVSQGVERSQLIAHGYGDTKPMNNNETKLDKANNRRVEFRVISTEILVKNQGIKIDPIRNMEAKSRLTNEINQSKSLLGNNMIVSESSVSGFLLIKAAIIDEFHYLLNPAVLRYPFFNEQGISFGFALASSKLYGCEATVSQLVPEKTS